MRAARATVRANPLTTESRLRLQVRVVRVIYRAELARLKKADATLASLRGELADLRSRCLTLLETVRAELDGAAVSPPDLLAELDDIEDEVSGPTDVPRPGP